jgi:hypothetical protein
MSIHTRADLIQYALRKLGSPVIKIEVDMTQVEDRVDEALQYFQDFHYDGTERVYLKHAITGSQINVDNGAGFVSGEVVIGTSGAKFQIASISGNALTTKAVFKDAAVNGTFTVGEVLTGQTSGISALFVSKVIGDIENGYVPISDMVTGIVRAIPWWHATSNSNYMFDPKYQVILTTFQNLSNSSLIYYSQLMSHIALMDQLLRPIDSVRFNRKTSKVYLDYDWTDAEIGSYLVFECYRILDPETVTTIYNDRMLKKLVTAKIKFQWASNSQKYAGIQLLGGVTIDASTLMSQAVAEIESAETEIRDSYEIPPIGFVA